MVYIDIIMLLGFAETINKSNWPELVGVDGNNAKEIIENENRRATGVILPQGTAYSLDICCNRVFIWVDDKGNTVEVPMLG
ncbi:hypothetical protein BT93_H1302 [Corymbia citriodora subsp. variegata]|nr:hypothetical protein BT93_H1302 [Corymbia citriodora subsp. variegata]